MTENEYEMIGNIVPLILSASIRTYILSRYRAADHHRHSAIVGSAFENLAVDDRREVWKGRGPPACSLLSSVLTLGTSSEICME